MTSSGRVPVGPPGAAHPGLIERWRDRLDVDDTMPVVTLGEGNTPLVYACHLSEILNAEVWLKLEGCNPTGSFKDRGMTLAVSKAVGEGAKTVVCASTGNTSASASAYAARAGIRCAVLIPEGKVALGKLTQAIMHGATVLQVRGSFDAALDIVRELGRTAPVTVVNSINPHRLEGQKTAAFELVDAFGDAPHLHVLPVGNAGNISAYWRGYVEDREIGRSTRLPRMFGVQAAGAAPFVQGSFVDVPETIATAIRIGKPASWDLANDALERSEGLIRSVEDEQILSAYKFLAEREGVFCEPSSATSVAGLLAYGLPEGLPERPTVVCILTGNGLKDPDTALSAAVHGGDGIQPVVVDSTYDAVASALAL